MEAFVPGIFAKHVNNDGKCIKPQDGFDPAFNDIFEKAQSLVHYTYTLTYQKVMLWASRDLDTPCRIQKLQLFAEDEIYFCCGNLSTVSIANVLKQHTCNKFCKMMISDDSFE